ncbi:hypothetical protein SAMN05216421_0851 [Halopseudomonas xinjiangensis]|uniref:Uncharacterized protein n=1 Tax=Halopseudomonas xinjiangensis TaxID=487184 RepID=A0A1H1P7X5_9GAMM|nr:hypothetical protein [Halopseudomonas xinjiangensis]SDS07085.1 hypothetical protein SAMN05216421_0851 [Halopseudomonas xinjiangensis]
MSFVVVLLLLLLETAHPYGLNWSVGSAPGTAGDICAPACQNYHGASGLALTGMSYIDEMKAGAVRSRAALFQAMH